jgi:predicted aspartyl protease
MRFRHGLRRCRWIFPLACVTLVACQNTADHGKCELNAAIDLPVTTAHRAFLTDITIDGGDAHVEIDTGSFENLLSAETASRLKMYQQALYGVTARGIGGSRNVSLAVSHSVTVGTAQAKKIGFLTVANWSWGPDVDGLLGMPFMVPYDDDLDLASGHLRLIETHGDCSGALPPFVGSVYAADLEKPAQSDTPVVTVAIRGIKLKAAIDTGAATSVLFRSAARQLALPVDRLMSETKARIGGIGPYQPRAAYGWLRLPVEIGGLDISNLPFAIADENSGDGTDMLLGYDFVTTVHVWISHSSHRVLMEYPPHPTPIAAQK